MTDKVAELVKKNDRYEVNYKGKKLVSSKDKKSVVWRFQREDKFSEFGSENQREFVDQTGEIDDEQITQPKVDSRFTIHQRFQFMEQLTEMVVDKQMASLIVTGEAGVGKTHTIMEVVEGSALKEGMDGGYTVIKGFSTPKSLYRALYENSHSLVIFDDCDSVLKDSIAVNILKAGLDSYDKRIIHWRSEKETDLPTSFEFRGQIIFISNLAKNKFNAPVVSRSVLVDVSMSFEEKVERMRSKLDKLDPDMSFEQKSECLDLMVELQGEAFDFNFRTLLRVMKIRKNLGEASNWKELATYMVTQ